MATILRGAGPPSDRVEYKECKNEACRIKFCAKVIDDKAQCDVISATLKKERLQNITDGSKRFEELVQGRRFGGWKVEVGFACCWCRQLFGGLLGDPEA